MENVALYWIKSNVCPKCEVLPGELGTDAKSHQARDYARYERCERESASDDTRKALPPYLGFFVLKKAYREVTQWQGKEMGTLGGVIWGFSP